MKNETSSPVSLRRRTRPRSILMSIEPARELHSSRQQVTLWTVNSKMYKLRLATLLPDLPPTSTDAGRRYDSARSIKQHPEAPTANSQPRSMYCTLLSLPKAPTPSFVVCTWPVVWNVLYKTKPSPLVGLRSWSRKTGPDFLTRRGGA